MGLHTANEIKSVGFSAYWVESTRQILNKGDLSAYWVGILFDGDFLRTTPSYTLIRDLMLRLCCKLIAYNIAGRRRKPGAMISIEKFVARLAEHFRLLTKERLKGLMMIVQDLSMIDMAELMMDQARVRYTSYSDYEIPYQRRTRRRTDEAITSEP
nr:hypothetical protein [Tanacetum cinerariifolium]